MTSPEYKDRKYKVVSYNENWPKQFAVEAEKLKSIFGMDAVGIEHIGSSAVPGMAGKPTIDILVLVNDIAVVDKYNQQMETIGYKSKGAYVMPDSRLFVKEKDNLVFVNTHFFEENHPHVKNMVGLRDYFRTQPEAVKEYSDFKVKLYNKFKNDYAQYRKLKDVYMNDLKRKIGL